MTFRIRFAPPPVRLLTRAEFVTWLESSKTDIRVWPYAIMPCD